MSRHLVPKGTKIDEIQNNLLKIFNENPERRFSFSEIVLNPTVREIGAGTISDVLSYLVDCGDIQRYKDGERSLYSLNIS